MGSQREVLANDRQVMSTYHAHASSSIEDECGGRYGFVREKPQVVGTSPITYPQLPEGSPWKSDPCPTEPPLGIDINAQEPVGEPHEELSPNLGDGKGQAAAA